MDTVKAESVFILITGTKASRGQTIPLNVLIAYEQVGRDSYVNKDITKKTSVRAKTESTTVDFGFKDCSRLLKQANLLYSTVIKTNSQLVSFVDTSLNFLLYIPDLMSKISKRTHIIHIDNLLCFTLWRLYKEENVITDYKKHLISPTGFGEWYEFFCLPKEDLNFPALIDHLPSYAPGFLVRFNKIEDESLILMDGVIGDDLDFDSYHKPRSSETFIGSGQFLKKRILFINKICDDKINANHFMKSLTETEDCAKLLKATSSEDWLWYYNTYQASAANFRHYILYNDLKFKTSRGEECALDRVVYSNLLSFIRVACNPQKRLSHYVDIARPLFNFKIITSDAMHCLKIHLHCLKNGVKLVEWDNVMTDDQLIKICLKNKLSDKDDRKLSTNINIDRVELFFKWYDNDTTLSKDPLFGAIDRHIPKSFTDIKLRQPAHLIVDESMKRCINFVRAVIVKNFMNKKRIIIVGDGGTGILDDNGNDGGGREVNNICNKFPTHALWYDHRNSNMITVRKRLMEPKNVDKIASLVTMTKQAKGYVQKNPKEFLGMKNDKAVEKQLDKLIASNMTRSVIDQFDDLPGQLKFDYGIWFSNGGDVLTSRWNLKDAKESGDFIMQGIARPHVFRYAQDWTYIAPHHVGTIELDQLVYQCYNGKYYYADSQFKEEGYVIKGIDYIANIRSINMLEYFHLLTANMYAKKGEEVSIHKYPHLKDKITPASHDTMTRMLTHGLTESARVIMDSHTVWFIRRN